MKEIINQIKNFMKEIIRQLNLEIYERNHASTKFRNL